MDAITEATRAQLDHHEAIHEAHAEVDRRESEVAQAKDSVKEAKARFDRSQSELRELIRSGPDYRDIGQPAELATSNPDCQADEPSTDPEAWRGVEVDTFMLRSFYRPLQKAGFRTLGHITDWCDEHRLIDIAGIAEAKVTGIENALVKFWADHPEHCVVPAEPAGEDAEVIADDGLPDDDAVSAPTDADFEVEPGPDDGLTLHRPDDWAEPGEDVDEVEEMLDPPIDPIDPLGWLEESIEVLGLPADVLERAKAAHLMILSDSEAALTGAGGGPIYRLDQDDTDAILHASAVYFREHPEYIRTPATE